MNRTKTDKPRTILLYLGGPGRKAGIDYVYTLLTTCYFLSSGGGIRGSGKDSRQWRYQPRLADIPDIPDSARTPSEKTLTIRMGDRYGRQ
jgi:hypothetical protein